MPHTDVVLLEIYITMIVPLKTINVGPAVGTLSEGQGHWTEKRGRLLVGLSSQQALLGPFPK